MSQEQELQRLEDFISKLLEKFNALKEENARITSELSAREATIAEMKDQLESNDIEKLEIGDRVSRMLEKIEDWESTSDAGTIDGDPHDAEETDEAADEDVPVNDPSRQGSLFKVADEELDG